MKSQRHLLLPVLIRQPASDEGHVEGAVRGQVVLHDVTHRLGHLVQASQAEIVEQREDVGVEDVTGEKDEADAE